MKAIVLSGSLPPMSEKFSLSEKLLVVGSLVITLTTPAVSYTHLDVYKRQVQQCDACVGLSDESDDHNAPRGGDQCGARLPQMCIRDRVRRASL